MSKVMSIAFLAFLSFTIVHAQKSNDKIASQIRSLKAEKTIELTYDEAANTSKIMARADNVDAKEASKAGIQAMNFGMAVFYAGQSLSATPETINLTFWVLTKKPQFAASHNWIVTTGTETLDFGEARYASKPGESMEYLNFKVSEADLAKIAEAPNARLKLGNADFSFTSSQMTTLKNFILLLGVR
jgi:hypothetical protein